VQGTLQQPPFALLRDLTLLEFAGEVDPVEIPNEGVVPDCLPLLSPSLVRPQLLALHNRHHSLQSYFTHEHTCILMVLALDEQPEQQRHELVHYA
jgi:hypothetical protein